MLCVSVGDVMDVVFSVCIVKLLLLVYGKFRHADVVCLCASCGSSQCCVLHNFLFVNAG